MYEKFGMKKNVVPLQAKRKNVTIMTSNTTIQGVYVNVPAGKGQVLSQFDKFLPNALEGKKFDILL